MTPKSLEIPRLGLFRRGSCDWKGFLRTLERPICFWLAYRLLLKVVALGYSRGSPALYSSHNVLDPSDGAPN